MSRTVFDNFDWDSLVLPDFKETSPPAFEHQPVHVVSSAKITRPIDTFGWFWGGFHLNFDVSTQPAQLAGTRPERK